MAHSAYRTLSKIWRHSAISRARKIQIFNSIVVSKLIYGLSSAWLNTSERRRLDGFQNTCLRAIWNIKAAYISRVSNKTVLDLTGQTPLSQQLFKRQIKLFGEVARAPEGSVIRQATFCPGSLRSAADRYVRKRGRPRLEWVTEVQKLAYRAAGSMVSLEANIGCKKSWGIVVDQYYM